MKKVLNELFKYKDEKYKQFSIKSIPNIDSSNFIGVRMPIIKKYASSFIKEKEYNEFICELPHKYIEENILHSYLINLNSDEDKIIELLDAFLPYVDNWEVCDIINPKIFKKNIDKLYQYVKKCIKSKYTYQKRFGIVMLLKYFSYPKYVNRSNKQVINIISDEYYINMARAWYFSYALINSYEQTINIFENKILDKWTHNKSIQKAIESHKINEKYKRYLALLKY